MNKETVDKLLLIGITQEEINLSLKLTSNESEQAYNLLLAVYQGKIDNIIEELSLKGISKDSFDSALKMTKGNPNDAKDMLLSSKHNTVADTNKINPYQQQYLSSIVQYPYYNQSGLQQYQYVQQYQSIQNIYQSSLQQYQSVQNPYHNQIPQQMKQEGIFNIPTKAKIRKIDKNRTYGFIQCENIGPDLFFSISDLIGINPIEIEIDRQVWCIPIQSYEKGKLNFIAKFISDKMGTTRLHYGTSNKQPKVQTIPNKVQPQVLNTIPNTSYTSVLHSISKQEQPQVLNTIPNTTHTNVLHSISKQEQPQVLNTIPNTTKTLVTHTKTQLQSQTIVNTEKIQYSTDSSSSSANISEEKTNNKKTKELIYYGKILNIDYNKDIATVQSWNLVNGWFNDTIYTFTSKDLRANLHLSTLKEETKIEFKLDDKNKLSDITLSTVIMLSEMSEDIKKNMYILGKQVNIHESKTTEFKSFSNSFLPTDDSKSLIEKYSVGFLNSFEGGSLIFGIENDGTTTGTKLNFNSPIKHKDDINLSIDSVMKGCNPPIDPISYKVIYHNLYKTKFEGYRVMNDRWIIEIKIKPSTNYLTIYETSGKLDKTKIKYAFIRNNASTSVMTPSMISNRINMSILNINNFEQNTDIINIQKEHKPRFLNSPVRISIIEEESKIQDNFPDKISDVNIDIINKFKSKIGLDNIDTITNAIKQLVAKNIEVTINNIAALIYG